MKNIFDDNKNKYDATSINSYSTEEQIVGTWIDGKPLYRKIYKVNSLPNHSSMTIPFNISNLDLGVHLYGTCNNSARTTQFPLPFYRSDDTSGIEIYGANGNINIVTGTDRTNLSAEIIFEYTKTTD